MDILFVGPKENLDYAIAFGDGVILSCTYTIILLRLILSDSIKKRDSGRALRRKHFCSLL